MKFPAFLSELIVALSPPQHEDERFNILVTISYYMCITLFAVAIYFLITLSAPEQFIGRAICGLLAISALTSFVILMRGYFRMACCISLVLAYFSSVAAAILNEGVSSVPMQAIPVILLLMSAFMGRRMVTVFGGVTLLSVVFMVWLDSAGFYALGTGPILIPTPGIVSAGIMIATCFIVFVIVKNTVGNSQTLIDAKAMAEEQNRLKNKYFATMTHELRTPLNAIIGYSEDIMDIEAEEDIEIDAEVFEDVQHIHKAGKYLQSLINDILDFSKIESEGVDVFVNQFSGLDLINEIYATVYPIAKENGNVLISGLEFDQKLATDRQKLRQILINLLSNAAKFTQDGEIHLYFDLIDENTYQFKVSDTGIGIPEEYLPQLFDSYSQAKNAKSAFKGTGLGLAISKKLTEVLDGELSVESQLNVGTTFILTLPNLSPNLSERPQMVEMAG